MPAIRRAVPNERWEIILEFEREGFRLFPTSVAREEKGFSFLAYPQELKNLTSDAAAVRWGTRGSLNADYLYRKSRPIGGRELRDQWLRVDYMNQAPTPADPNHHVYEVGIKPFDRDEPFTLAESIHGGFFDNGGSLGFSLERLLCHPGRERHFERSGCAWAVEIVRQDASGPDAILDKLVKEICRRADEAGAARPSR